MRYTITGLFLFAFGVLVAVMGFLGSAEDKAVRDNGEKTTAAVVDKGIEKQQNRDTTSENHWLALKFFDLKQGEHDAKRNVDQSLWEQTKIGDTISIKYLTEKPDVVRLESETQDNPMILAYVLSTIGGIMAVLGIGAAVYGAKRGSRSFRAPESV